MGFIDWLRGKLRQRRARRISRRPPSKTPYGFLFVGPAAMQEGTFEKAEVDLLSSLFDNADLFVNVGANYGFYLCHAAQKKLPCVAVEPISENVALLKRNLELNGFEDLVELNQCACGSETGEVTLFGTGTGASAVEGWARNPKALNETVPVRRLDDILKGRSVSERTVILCDVEGFELEVLKGASATLGAASKPVWLLESGLSNPSAPDDLSDKFLAVFDLLTEHGYEMFPMRALDRPIQRDLIVKSLQDRTDLIQEDNFLVRARS